MLTYAYCWMSNLMASMKKEEGQGMAEYGLILALVAVLLIGVFGFLQGGIEGALQGVVDALPGG